MEEVASVTRESKIVERYRRYKIVPATFALLLSKQTNKLTTTTTTKSNHQWKKKRI